MIYDYIIIGQGLAGSIVSSLLLDKESSLLVIDNNLHYSSSMVAAGMYNPIVFKKINKSWKTDELLPAADVYYRKMEKLLNTFFYHKRNIIRFFSSIEESNNWSARSGEIGFEKYLNDDELQEVKLLPINNAYGYGSVKQAGYLDISLFLTSYRKMLIEQELIKNEVADYSSITFNNDAVTLNGYEAKNIIFCEGYQSVNNPYFNALPFNVAKGEVLTITCKSLGDIKHTLNKGFFILPVGNNTYKVGATFEWRDKDHIPTEKGRKELTDKIDKLLNVPYEVVEHKAGIRPTVKDRRPLLGQHPQHKQLSIFNGLGTKGVMIAPYFANQFVKFLLEGSPLDSEVNISRYTF